MRKPNPFSTRFVRPGKIDYVESQTSVKELARRIIESKHNFQIVGSHGSGKTTCTISLARELGQSGVDCRWITLRQQNRFSLPTAQYENHLSDDSFSSENQQVLFIDGIESLSYVQRLTTLTNLAKSNIQVVVTTHRKLLGIPVLTTTSTTLELFRQLAARLYDDESPEWTQCVDDAYLQCRGDIREAFFVLYDQWDYAVAADI